MYKRNLFTRARVENGADNGVMELMVSFVLKLADRQSNAKIREFVLHVYQTSLTDVSARIFS